MATSNAEKQTLCSTSPMKQSVSLNSLPPPNGSQDVLDMAVAAKLIIERPYNSLKVSGFIVKNSNHYSFWEELIE